MPSALLSERDHERILELSWSLAGMPSSKKLTTAALEMTYQLVGADEVGYSEVNLGRSVHQVTFYPDSPALPEILPRLHRFANKRRPIFRELSSSGNRWAPPLKMSSVIPMRDLVRTPLYELTFKPRGIRYQAVMPIHLSPAGPTGTGYSFNRSSRDFNCTEMNLIHAVQPVLAAHVAALQVRTCSDEQKAAARSASRLTDRELEILSLVASGMTAVAIGHALRISPRTVRKHVENSYAKLDIHDRLEAASYCRQAGLLRS